ncbi:MAG TPA: hypothetical protein VNW97_15000 [Candidatus Saccharimonadales bacterium]|nr:hypothetical protein [Candidatus Saccharimonadales bacterium]
MKKDQFRAMLLLAALTIFVSAAFAQTVEVSTANSAVSGPVSDMKGGLAANGPLHQKPLRLTHSDGISNSPDTVVQTSAVTGAAAVTSGLNFEGLGNGFSGFSVNAAPPDTNGAVGATQFVQWVNESFEVFNKSTGAAVKGPVAGNQLFQALGATHPCAVNNDGDPIAQYDKANGRWVLTQFSVTNGASAGFFQCVAVSQTSDATGAFNVYAFTQPNFNDYPKVGIWTNGYYATYNIFSGNTFQGPRICAMDGAAMRAGATATQQCVQLANTFGSVLPSDIDGTTAPPAGTDPYFVAFGSNLLNVWRFHVDFATPANTVLNGPTTTTVASFATACAGGSCIPQPGTKQRLDSLGDRVMYRFAYRHFADGHEALVVNHSVTPGGAAVSGVRWYELRPNAANGGLSVFQQGTFAPADGVSRWMGSIAQDKVGNIVVGYSASSGSLNPSIRFANRAAADPAGTLGTETTITTGGGAQTRTLNRWGDYSALTVDPADDCTFWYTNEYLSVSGTFNWHTRIASFKLGNCI